MALRVTVRFPRTVFGPVERSAFLRLAWTLRSDTGRFRSKSSGDGEWRSSYFEVPTETH